MADPRRMPWDCARCDGAGCTRKIECLRHEQLNNMGERTPIFSTCRTETDDGSVTWPMFIPLEEPSNG